MFPQMQKIFLSVLPKGVYPVSLRMHIKSAQMKPAKHKKTSRGKISKQSLTIFSKTYNLEAKKRHSGVRKKAYSSLNLLLLPSLTIRLDMEQFVLVPASVYNKSLITQSVKKQELPKYQPSQNPTYQVDSFKKEINKKIFFQSRLFFSRQSFFSCPRIKLSNSQTLFLGGVVKGFSLFHFAQQLRRRNADIPKNYFTLLDAAGIPPTLILNLNATAKERGSWVPLTI